MLFPETVKSRTLVLLKELQESKALDDCPLAGGTALALQIGHRISEDLDFFSPEKLDFQEIKYLFETYPDAQELSFSKHIMVWSIQNIKVDVVNYRYPQLFPFIKEQGLILYSLGDIAAMKLEAIKGWGKKRDFYDLYFLLKTFDLSKMLALNQKKFKSSNGLMVLKSLTYFEDAEEDPDVKVPNNKERVDWNAVKEFISQEVNKLS